MVKKEEKHAMLVNHQVLKAINIGATNEEIRLFRKLLNKAFAEGESLVVPKGDIKWKRKKKNLVSRLKLLYSLLGEKAFVWLLGLGALRVVRRS